MGLSRKRKVSIGVTVLLFIFFLFANIYAIRRMSAYAVELFFYDRMLVAYQVGGMPGVNNELERILSQDKMPRELRVAATFKKSLQSLKSPEEFLRNAVEAKKEKINLFRNLRNLAFGFIIVLVLLRAALNFRAKPGK